MLHAFVINWFDAVTIHLILILNTKRQSNFHQTGTRLCIRKVFSLSFLCILHYLLEQYNCVKSIDRQSNVFIFNFWYSRIERKRKREREETDKKESKSTKSALNQHQSQILLIWQFIFCSHFEQLNIHLYGIREREHDHFSLVFGHYTFWCLCLSTALDFISNIYF